MIKTFSVYLQSDQPWECEAETEREERRQRYLHGAELIAKYGEFDIDDQDQLDVLRDALGPDEFTFQTLPVQTVNAKNLTYQFNDEPGNL